MCECVSVCVSRCVCVYVIANFDINSTPNAAAIAVAKNGGDFLETVNNIVNEMKESGKIEELYQLNDQIVTDNTAE